jgi:hypothetical protein
MPPTLFSRYQFCVGFTDPTTGAFILNERVPFPYKAFADNRQHIVSGGDTLWGLAHRFFRGVTANPAWLWWVIADFQPQPIIDPTIDLAPGQVIVIPSPSTLKHVVFSSRLQQTSP